MHKSRNPLLSSAYPNRAATRLESAIGPLELLTQPPVRRPQVSVLGSAEPGSSAFALAGGARNLLMALAGDACLVIGGRAGTISEVCLAWLHKRPLLPLTGCGGWSDGLLANPPDERKNSKILPWGTVTELESQLRDLGLVRLASSAGAD